MVPSLDQKIRKVDLLHHAAAKRLVVRRHELVADDVLRAGLLEVRKRQRRQHVERDVRQARLVRVEQLLESRVAARTVNVVFR